MKLLAKKFDLRSFGRKSVKKAEKEEIGRQPAIEKEDNEATILDVEFDKEDKVVFEQKIFVEHQDSTMFRRQSNFNVKEVGHRRHRKTTRWVSKTRHRFW